MKSLKIIPLLAISSLFILAGCNAKPEKQVPDAEKTSAEQAVKQDAPEVKANANEAAPEAKVDAPAAAPEAKVDAPTAAPEAKVDAPAAAPEANADAPAAAPDDKADAPAAAPDDKADAPTAAPEANADANKAAPRVKRNDGSSTSENLFKREYLSRKVVSDGTVCEEPEGCDCKGVKCPMNAKCGDQCYCGNTVVSSDYEGYVCMEVAKDVYSLGCTEKDGCPCGKIKVYSNMGCEDGHATCAGTPVPGRGLSCSHKPYQKWLYSLNCFNDECDCYGETIHKGEVCAPLECERGYEPSVIGCACGGHKDDGKSECVLGKGGKLVSYCTSDEGCECGEATCPAGGVCYHNKCVDRTSLKEIPEGYQLSFGIPKCQDETCACGKKGKCQQGKYCLDGLCLSDPYRRSIDSKIYYYHIFSKDIVDAGPKEKYRNDLWSLLFVGLNNSDDETSPVLICDVFDSVKEKGSDEDICKSETNGSISIAEILKRCGTGVIPEKVAAMYCTLDVVDGALQFSGWEEE